jgi:hypothetical protein
VNAPSEPAIPLLRIVSGEPHPDEVAALTVVLSLAAAPASEAGPPAPGPWSDPATRLRRAPAPGPGAWRSSALH